MKILIIKTLSVIFIITLFISCKKDLDDKIINISGKVLNESTNLPIAGITVSLNESCGVGWSTVASAITDNNGAYSIKKKDADCSGYKIDINASPNYSSNYSTQWYEVKPNQELNKTNYIYRNASLKVTANTTSPLGPNDDFFMNLPGTGCGCFQKTTNRAKGDFYNEISWSVTRNNVVTNFSDSVYCPVGTLKLYTINY